MKKTIFAALCCAALFGFTACEETISKDIAVTVTENFSYSSVGGGSGVNHADIKSVFMEELSKIGERPKELSYTVILRQQTDAKSVKTKVQQAADNADKRVKNELGVPDKLNPDYSKLKIGVEYPNIDDEKVTLTYTYKE